MNLFRWNFAHCIGLVKSTYSANFKRKSCINLKICHFSWQTAHPWKCDVNALRFTFFWLFFNEKQVRIPQNQTKCSRLQSLWTRLDVVFAVFLSLSLKSRFVSKHDVAYCTYFAFNCWVSTDHYVSSSNSCGMTFAFRSVLFWNCGVCESWPEPSVWRHWTRL